MANILLVGYAAGAPLALAEPAPHPSPSPAYQPKNFEVGVLTDMAEVANLNDAENAIQLIQRSGFNVLKETVQIATGQNSFDNPSNDPNKHPMSSKDQKRINNSLKAATDNGLDVNLALWPVTWVEDYRPPEKSWQIQGFCQIGADLVKRYVVIKKVSIATEPNNPTFAPQFLPDGTDAYAGKYVRELATCYKMIHAAADERGVPITIVGGELAPSGNDDPHSGRPSHSPTSELANICKAYADSSIDTPLMDELSVHYYMQPQEKTIVQHPNSTTYGIGDYDKIVKAKACLVVPGKEQTNPPLSWGEGAVNTLTPDAPPRNLLPLYGDIQNQANNAVDESIQGPFMVDAITAAYCDQPQTTGIYNFGLVDSKKVPLLRTGFFYPPPGDKLRIDYGVATNLTAKPGFKDFRKAVSKVADGTICTNR